MPRRAKRPRERMTDQQVLALGVLLQGGRKRDAAAAAGVCRQTLTEWLREPVFSGALQRGQRDVVEATAALARLGSAQAIQTLIGLLKHEDAKVEIAAARVLLAHVRSLPSEPEPEAEIGLPSISWESRDPRGHFRR